MLRRRTAENLLLLWLLASGLGAGQAYAQSAQCFRTRDLAPTSAWNMLPSGTSFRNGDRVGWVAASMQYFLPIAQGNTVQVIAGGVQAGNAFDATPLAGMPGLGLRLLWLGYSATTTLTPLVPTAPAGTSVSSRSWFRVMEARTAASYTLTQFYRFELVVIDEKLYKGGKLTFTESGKIYVVTSNKTKQNTYQNCVNGWVDAMTALTGSVQVPELPEPVQPTCKFDISSLNQRIQLGAVDPGQVAAYGSPRPVGQDGQGRFSVRANACDKGTLMYMYFTDNRNATSTADYLSSSKEEVGVRVYFSNDANPIRFGPPPLGASLPTRDPLVLGPVPFDNLGMTLDFVAQYVRRPHTGPVTPGPLQADMTFTIVYP